MRKLLEQNSNRIYKKGMDMAFQRSTCIRDALLAMYREAAAKMSAYPRLPDGSTPDAIKATPEWGKNKEAFDLASVNFRDFNKAYVKRFAAEIRAEHSAKFRSS